MGCYKNTLKNNKHTLSNLYFQCLHMIQEIFLTKSAKEQTQNTRKSETDAIVPLLPQIRAEGTLLGGIK